MDIIEYADNFKAPPKIIQHDVIFIKSSQKAGNIMLVRHYK